MAALHVTLIHSSTCFINLPRNRIPRAASLDTGFLTIEVRWQNLTSDSPQHKLAYFGWIGAKQLRFPTIWPIAMGWIVDNVKVADEVQVEPLTCDDWEILEQQADYIESGLLQQINVVYPGMHIPVWVHKSTIIHMKVLKTFNESCLRLGPNTQVLVAPKERQGNQNNHEQTDTSINSEVFSSFLLQPLSYSTGDIFSLNLKEQTVCLPHSNCALLHPINYRSIEGISSPDRIFAAIWAGNNNPLLDFGKKNSSQEQESLERNRESPIVVTLVPSSLVSYGHIMLHPLLSDQMDISPSCRLYIRLLPSCSKQNITSITLSKLMYRRNELVEEDGDELQIKASFVNWCRTNQECEKPVAITSRMTFVSFNFNGKEIKASVKIFSDDTIQSEKSKAEGEGDIPYFLLSDLSLDTVYYDKSRYLVTNAVSPSFSCCNYHDLGGVDDIIKTLSLHISPLVHQRIASLRTLAGFPPPGNFFLYGSKGCGKTSVLRAVANLFHTHWESFSSVYYLECRELRGQSMQAVKDELTSVFVKALSHAPSIVVLDDLDTLIPAESDEPGAPNMQAQQLADHLAELLLTIRRYVVSSSTEIKNLLVNSEKDKAVLSLITGNRCVSKSVAVLASGRALTTIHQSLRSTRLFDRSAGLKLPDAVMRDTIFSKLLSRKDIILSNCVDISFLVHSTEGYSIEDMVNLVDHCLHGAVLRYLKEVNLDIKTSSKTLLKASDLNKALKTFTPSALRSIQLFKSDVSWEDVGGLRNPKKMLKDILELPTKYRKLFETSPIKLPSGILLYGPPGCGKTLLAAAVASSFKLNFISVKGPEVLNKYIGASEQAVRDLFARAAAAAPCILFLDEFDSLAPRRGADNTGVTDRVVNQLLTFLDGIESREGIYILGATSRPDLIDPALLRPGRLDKSLYCGFPTQEERLEILYSISKKMKISSEAHNTLSYIANAPESRYFSGADLHALLNSAQLAAVHSIMSLLQVNEENKKENKLVAPVIEKSHLINALKETRPSVSTDDRRKFERIYFAFTRSRSTTFSAANGEFSCNLQRTALV